MREFCAVVRVATRKKVEITANYKETWHSKHKL